MSKQIREPSEAFRAAVLKKRQEAAEAFLESRFPTIIRELIKMTKNRPQDFC
jgi:hypothetical protein